MTSNSGAHLVDKVAMLKSIDRSLSYLETPAAIKAYQNYAVNGINLDRVRRSLVRFRQLLNTSRSADQLQAAVNREFVFYQSVGKDNKGTVLFTGYYEPIYEASPSKKQPNLNTHFIKHQLILVPGKNHIPIERS